jgi:hypothetical protein
MNVQGRIVALFLALALPCAMASADQKLDHLLVYGEGFAFGVKEPPGWRGDTEHAEKWGANVVFYRPPETVAHPVAGIRVRVGEKTDEDTAEDLAADMESYRKQDPGVQFSDFGAAHPAYAVHSKLFFVPGKFYEYVAYANPGPGRPWLFSVAMNTTRPATEEELAAFRLVLKSLDLLSGKGR